VSGVDQVRRLACHWLLLRLAGTAPDDLITQCRRWLGQERLLGIGRPVTYAVPSQHFLLANPDIDLLAELLAADGADTSALSMVSVADFDPMPPCGFAPTRARSGAGQCAAADARPGPPLANAEPEDDIDRIGSARPTRLRRYERPGGPGSSPDFGLLAHVRERGYRCWTVPPCTGRWPDQVGTSVEAARSGIIAPVAGGDSTRAGNAGHRKIVSLSLRWP
jgi:hypothetical protein